MDIRAPRSKKHCRLSKPKPLPIIPKVNGEIYKFQGIFDGFTVKITDEKDMKTIISMGCFGKGSLSKSFPQFNGTLEKPQIIRRRQMQRRKELAKKSKSARTQQRKVIVLPDSGSDNEEYFKNLQPTYEIDASGLKETTNLMLEEAFFLKNALGCLDIHYEDRILEDDAIWKLFTENDPLFQRNYAVYYFFRARNWVVKPGLKFGGDYLLYKHGPQYYHASYVVLIKREDESVNSTSMIGLQRMCETAGKELLICIVSLPKENFTPDELSGIGIRLILKKRWDPSKEREDSNSQVDIECL